MYPKPGACLSSHPKPVLDAATTIAETKRNRRPGMVMVTRRPETPERFGSWTVSQILTEISDKREDGRPKRNHHTCIIPRALSLMFRR